MACEQQPASVEEPYAAEELFPPRVLQQVALWNLHGTGITDEYFEKNQQVLLYIDKAECDKSCQKRLYLMQSVEDNAARLFVVDGTAPSHLLQQLEQKYPGLLTAIAPTASAYDRFYRQIVNEEEDREGDQKLPIYLIQSPGEITHWYSGQYGNPSGLKAVLQEDHE